MSEWVMVEDELPKIYQHTGHTKSAEIIALTDNLLVMSAQYCETLDENKWLHKGVEIPFKVIGWMPMPMPELSK